MNTSGPLVLGIDLGTSAVKVIATGLDGSLAAVGSAPFATIRDLPDQAEQDPASWVAATAEAIADLELTLRDSDPGWKARVSAIGVAGQLPTLVCCDARGPLGPAITWQDARADAPTLAALDPAQRRDLYRRTGMPIDGRYLGPMFRHHWLARSANVEFILSAKDYLVSVLTDRRLTDPSTAAGYGAYDLAAGSFARDLADLWKLPPAALPPVRPAHSTAGALSEAAARRLGMPAGIQVTVGGADSVSGAFAMTALQPEIVCIMMGSSTVILDAIREARLDPAARYLLTPHAETGWFGREMDLLATGTGYRWLSGLLRLPPGKLEQLAAEAAPGAGELVFAPYLAGGEQGALWNPTLRASISGLTLQHGASEIARAFLEGVAFEIRRCIDVLAETAPVREVVISGHLAEHRASLQMLADILHRPVQQFPTLSPAALGAALGAARALGGAPHEPATRSWPPKVLPTAQANTYDRLYESYLHKTRA